MERGNSTQPQDDSYEYVLQADARKHARLCGGEDCCTQVMFATYGRQRNYCLLTRHFPYSIQNLIRSIAPRDIEAFQSLLGNYDITADNVMKGGKTSTTINAISTSVGGQEAKSSKQSDQPNNKKNDRNTEENNFRNETKDRTSKPGGEKTNKTYPQNKRKTKEEENNEELGTNINVSHQHRETATVRWSGNPMSNNVQAEYNVVPVISVGDPPTGVIWNMVTTNEYPYRCPVIEVCCGDVVMKALVDTGSMATIMDEDAYNALRNRRLNYLNCQLKVRELQLRLETSRARSKKQIYAPLEIGGKVYDTPCLVVKGLTYAVILGIDFLVENDVIVDTRAAKILIGRGNARINTMMKFDEEKLIENEDEIDLCSSATNDLIESIEEKVNSADLLDKEQKAKLSKLLISAKRVFEKNREPVKNYVFRIQLTDETPFKGRSYPIPVAYQEAIQTN